MIIKSKDDKKNLPGSIFGSWYLLLILLVVFLLFFMPSKGVAAVAVVCVVLLLEVNSRKTEIDISDDRLIIKKGAVVAELRRENFISCSIRGGLYFGA